MKNLLFVSVALSVFTVTSFSASAQFKRNLLIDLNLLNDVVEYGKIKSSSKFTTSLKKILSPVLMATELCSTIQFKYAQLLNKDVELVTNKSLFSFIDEWWSTRYKYGGTTKKGIDCSSYTGHLINKVFGFFLPRTAREQYAACSKINKADLLVGDLVFFNTRGGVSHVGVYLGEGYFTHSSCSSGVTINNLSDNYYSRKFIGGGRIMDSECSVKNL